jgi:hypothetical protein
MSREDRTPWWITPEDEVTPDDIRRWIKEALDDGADREELDRAFKKALRDAAGTTIEDLAEFWTRRNAFERNLRELRWHIGDRRKPRKPTPEPVRTQETMLRELIKRFPDVARDVLDNDEGEQPT